MDLVIDTNILISALISSNGKIRELIFSDKFKLFAPEYVFLEIYEHKQEIIKKAELSESEFELALSVLFTKIIITPSEEIKVFSEKAKQVCPDFDDWPFFALAILKNIPLWSDDKDLKQQDVIKVMSTKEIIALFLS
ncbi:MAG: PIN domain-containing protein [Candidatus ainarchaeum sp.]|nr:PIN domain-containing protein [Candidatus ainarchaeum sp.]